MSLIFQLLYTLDWSSVNSVIFFFSYDRYISTLFLFFFSFFTATH